MNNNMIKNLMITDSDLDGVGCAVLMNIFYPNNHTQFCTPRTVDEYFDSVYNEHSIDVYDNIFITDLSLSMNSAMITERYNNEVSYNKIKLLDHHKTAEWMNTYSWATVKTEYSETRHTCGTSLFWDYLMAEHDSVIDSLPEETIYKIHRFVELVRLWDTFEWKTSPMSKDAVGLKYMLDMYTRKDFIYNMVDNIITKGKTLFSDEDKIMMKFMQMKKDKYLDHKMKQVEMIKYKDLNVAFVFAEDFNSELGNRMCVDIDNVDFSVVVSPDTCKVSLRSVKDDIDVSNIAKEFDGGGHFHAAGYSLREDLVSNIKDNIFKK